MKNRVQLFQTQLVADELILLSTANDIYYFTQFEFLVPEEREAFLVLTKQHAFLIISSFSLVPSNLEIKILRGCQPATLAEHLKKIADECRTKKIVYQSQSLFVNELQAIQKKLSPTQFEFAELPTKAIWQQRMIKDETEIQALKKAGQIVAKATEEISKEFKDGISEIELAEKLETLFTTFGAKKPAFPTIVAFGTHGTSPHHQPGSTTLIENTSILIDCGTVIDGYRSDLTRTWWFGKTISPTFQEIEKIVKTAYETAVQKIQSHLQSATPITAKNIDEAARDVITQAGYGPQFIHTTGHGVGLDIHEPPSLSWNDNTIVRPGMVITVEPGIYLENQFGYRYENTLLVTSTGAEILTRA